MVLVSDRDVHKIKMLERKLKTSFERKKIPTGKEVCEKQFLALIHKVHNIEVNENDITQFMPVMETEFADMSKEEILKRFASIEFNRFLDYYKNAKDLNVSGERGGDRERRFDREDSISRNGDRMFINLGKMDGVMVPQLLELIDHICGIKGKEIGNIRLKGAYSVFEVDPKHTAKVVNAFKGTEYKGRQVRVEVQNDERDSSEPRERSGERYRENKPRTGSSRERHGGGRNRYGGDKEKFGGSGRRERIYKKK